MRKTERAIFDLNGSNYTGDVVRKNQKTVIVKVESEDGKTCKFIKRHRVKHNVMVVVSC